MVVGPWSPPGLPMSTLMLWSVRTAEKEKVEERLGSSPLAAT